MLVRIGAIVPGTFVEFKWKKQWSLWFSSDVSGAAICLPVCACCTGAEGLHSKCRQADTPQQSHPATADVLGRGKRVERRKWYQRRTHGSV